LLPDVGGGAHDRILAAFLDEPGLADEADMRRQRAGCAVGPVMEVVRDVDRHPPLSLGFALLGVVALRDGGPARSPMTLVHRHPLTAVSRLTATNHRDYGITIYNLS